VTGSVEGGVPADLPIILHVVPPPIDTSTITPGGSDIASAGIEYIAPPLSSPFASGLEGDTKNSFFRALRFSWKGLVSEGCTQSLTIVSC
jgi:hypothetical protein